MMQCVVLDGNLFDEVVLDELPMISNLCVRMMYLYVKRKDDVSTDQLRRNRRKEVPENDKYDVSQSIRGFVKEK